MPSFLEFFMSQPSVYSASGSTICTVSSTRSRPASSCRNTLRHSPKRVRTLPAVCGKLRRTVEHPFKLMKGKTGKHLVKAMTWRSVPLSQDAIGGMRYEVDQAVSHKESLNLEIVLLPPLATDQAEPLAKSCFTVTCPAQHRFAGAEKYDVGLRITMACKPITLVLPWKFCGIISLKNAPNTSMRVFHTAAVAGLLNQGRLRFGVPLANDEDEIELENPGSLKLYLMRQDEGLPAVRSFMTFMLTRTMQFD